MGLGSVVGPVFLSPLLMSCDGMQLLFCNIVVYEQDTKEDGILPLPFPQLYDIDEDVAMEALDVLDEACEEEVSSSVV